MASSRTFDPEFLRQYLGPDVTILDPNEVSSDEEEEEELITLHDTRDKAFERQCRLNAALKKPDSRHSRMAPTVSKPDPARAKELSRMTFDEYRGLKPGDYAEPGTQFTHWKLVEMYQHSYIGKTNRAKVCRPAHPFAIDF